MQQVEGQHPVKLLPAEHRGVDVGHREAQLWHRLRRQLLDGDVDHAGRNVGRQQAPGVRRQPQRGGAGAAADLQHVLIGRQQALRAPQRRLVTRHVGDRVGGVLAGDAVPETGLAGGRGTRFGQGGDVCASGGGGERHGGMWKVDRGPCDGQQVDAIHAHRRRELR